MVKSFFRSRIISVIGESLLYLFIVISIPYIIFDPDLEYINKNQIFTNTVLSLRFFAFSKSIIPPSVYQETSCPFETYPPLTFPKVGPDYRPIYHSFAHQYLDEESSIAKITPQMHANIDTLIKEAKMSLPVYPANISYEQSLSFARAVLPQIDCLLIRHGFVYPGHGGVAVLSDGLAPTIYTNQKMFEELAVNPSNVRRIQYIKHNKSHAFYVVDCDIGSDLFLAIGEQLRYPLHMVTAPGHAFIRWEADSQNTLDFETTMGYYRYWNGTYFTDNSLISEWHLPKQLVGVNRYLESLSENDRNAQHYSAIALAALNERNKRVLDDSLRHINRHDTSFSYDRLYLAEYYLFGPASTRSTIKALRYASEAYQTLPVRANAEILACAYAGNGDFAKAVALEKKTLSNAYKRPDEITPDHIAMFQSHAQCENELKLMDASDFRFTAL